ncbi:hypothetical protein Tco_1568362 [Tanacetum coccineum]
MEADDQAIQIILMGLPEDIYVADKKAKLFNEWERFTSTEGESDLHEVDYIQLYNFLKFNQAEVDAIRAERLTRTHDPLALMVNYQNPYNNPVFHPDQPYPLTYMQQPQPNNYILQPSFNTNYMQQPMENLEDILDPATAMNMTLVLMAKAFRPNYSTPTNNNQRTLSNPRNRQIIQPGMYMRQERQLQMVRGNGGNQFGQYTGQIVGNQNGYNAVQNVKNQVNVNQTRNGNVVTAQAEVNGTGNNEAGIQLQAEEFDVMAARDIDEIEEVNANCILIANLQQASTSGTQTGKAPVYDSNESVEVHNFENCYDNDIFNMFTQEEQYTELLEPITEPRQVQKNDNNVISEVSSVEQSGGPVEQQHAIVEETRVYFEALYNNLVTEVEKVNTVNRKMKETNTDLTTELARYRGQEISFEINKEKLDEHETDYRKSVYQEQCLTKNINVIHLSSAKQITGLNEVKDTIVTLQSVIKHRMNADINKWSSPAYQEFHKIIKDETTPIVNQADARVQNFKKHFVKEAAKFVRDFKSLAKEADESLDKVTVLEREDDHLLRAVVNQDIMSIVQSTSIVDTSNLQTKLDCTKEKLENSYNDMQNQIKWLQAQLGDLKGKSKPTQCASDTLEPLSQKLEDENVSLEFHDTIKGLSANTKFANQSTLGKPSLQPPRNHHVVRQPNAFQSE